MAGFPGSQIAYIGVEGIVPWTQYAGDYRRHRKENRAKNGGDDQLAGLLAMGQGLPNWVAELSVHEVKLAALPPSSHEYSVLICSSESSGAAEGRGEAEENQESRGGPLQSACDLLIVLVE
ncbi:hypothetical protein [Streptomyces sp. NBC_00233]|uniref:hypothetical protein n=1 Tax=Streptomyces sp. NBC_00233 TaxID=2975686 RepID=UPI00224C9983|nr:hypothetical protein [Streptomyces sp. NBC_00233]MCX5231447.1 hypothetical protein [Streptomyces sp. NBC_00233]MCX5233011.1 hypothetical protein [Streptomyces sp. NBC_00233]